MDSTMLTNFNVPVSIRQRFDDVCRASGRTRTSVLVELMENYVITQGKALAARAQEFERVDLALEESRRLRRSRDFPASRLDDDDFAVQSPGYPDFDLPSPMMTDGRDAWE